MTKSVLQCGLPINDAFTVALLLETVLEFYNIANFVDVIRATYLIGIYSLAEIHWLNLIYLASWTLQILLYPVFVWIGFITLNKRWCLKLWTITSLILRGLSQSTDFVYLMIANFDGSTLIRFQLIRLISTLILFGYIYSIYWMTLHDLSDGSDFRGFGRGLGNFFRYYKNEFKRMAKIILMTDIIWNFYIAIDIWVYSLLHARLVEMNDREEPNPDLRFGIPVRLTRVIFGVVGLYFIQQGRLTLLKWVYVPLLSLAVLAGSIIFLPIMFILNESASEGHVYTLTLYVNEVMTSLVLGVGLIYLIIKFVTDKRIQPQPFLSRGHVADALDE